MGIRDAYHRGKRGDELDEGARRRHRIAHQVGRRSLQRTRAAEAAAEAERAEYEHKRTSPILQAIEASHGVSASALRIILAAGQIPDGEGSQQSSASPAWGQEMRSSEGLALHVWNVSLINPGENSDNQRVGSRQVADNLGTLTIDSTDWSHNGLRVSVDNMMIRSVAPQNPDGTYGPASTSLWFNTRPYDASLKNLYEGGRGVLTGAGRIDVDPTGQITALSLEQEQATGYSVTPDLTTVTTNLPQFLNGVLDTVGMTNQLYAAVADVAL